MAKKPKTQRKQSETLTTRCVPEFKALCDVAKTTLGVSFAELVRIGVLSVSAKNIEEAIRLGVLERQEYDVIKAKYGGLGWPGAFDRVRETLELMEKKGFLMSSTMNGVVGGL